MTELRVLATLLCSLGLAVGACWAETIQSCLGHEGPAFVRGMTPSRLGWGPDDRPYPVRFVVNPADGAEMVWVPAGEFTMGSAEDEGKSDEHPQHKVMLSAFWMDKTEVTNEQYGRFLEYLKRTGDHGTCSKGEPQRKYHTPEYWTAAHLNGPRQPVGGVDWYDAYAYAAWAGKRLPTEAEWEKAARGTDGRRYPWGNDWDRGKCNVSGSGETVTVDVGSHLDGKSPYGCLDMAGNVWEWCADWYGEDYYRSSPRENPTGPADGPGRSLRGGSWVSDPHDCRSAVRSVFVLIGCSSGLCGGSMIRYADYGFRCAVTP